LPPDFRFTWSMRTQLSVVNTGHSVEPGWPYWGPEGGRYGWGPSGLLGLVLVVLLILALLGHV
jgi:hypothetical protein